MLSLIINYKRTKRKGEIRQHLRIFHNQNIVSILNIVKNCLV